MAKRLSYPRTTPSQRQRLFKIWQESGDLQQALREARVSLGTFYYWKPRFETGGYEALQDFASHAPQHPNRTAQKIVLLLLQKLSEGL